MGMEIMPRDETLPPNPKSITKLITKNFPSHALPLYDFPISIF
jgi:hypothetical protein